MERAGTSRAVHIVDVVSFSLCPKRAACGPTRSTQLNSFKFGTDKLIQFLGDAGLKLNAFTTIPYTTEFEYPSHLFRILLLRRLRLHLPLSARFCRCRRPLDPLGDHRAACAQSGVLRARGGPLERAAARICREGGARVTTNTRARGSQHPHPVQSRRSSHRGYRQWVTVWGGSQLAVDTTLVSPLTRSGEPRSRGGTFAGAALQDARRTKERTYPELLRNRRCRLVVLGIEVGGRCSNEASSFVRMLAQARGRSSPASLRAATPSALVSRFSYPCSSLFLRCQSSV